jgi:hypothetical protein
MFSSDHQSPAPHIRLDAHGRSSPGMLVTINGLGIQREIPGTLAPSGLVVDASEGKPHAETSEAKGPTFPVVTKR